MIDVGLNSASILAQVNFGTNSASILGIFLAVAGAALYFLRTVKPELSRDQDIFFAAVGLLCGFILIFQGWRLDPILQFGQLLLVGSTVFFAVESIRLRGIATEQAKRNTRIVDDERPVSKNYQYQKGGYTAEVDDSYDPLPYNDYEDDRPVRARIPGSRDTRPSRDTYYEDDQPRRNERRTRNERSDRSESNDRERPRRSNSGRTGNRSEEKFSDDEWGRTSKPPSESWDDENNEERRGKRRPSNNSYRPDMPEDDVAPRPKRRRPPSDAPRNERVEEDDAMAVDYKPLDQLDEEPGNSSSKYDDV